MPKVTGFKTVDVRFPTSRGLDGSDAMNKEPDYSAALLILETDDPTLEGHGFVFTCGRGNDLQCDMIEQLAPYAVGRDVADIRCAVNVGLAFTDESLKTQFGALADAIRPGVLTGSDDQVVEMVGRYVDAGAAQINVALRAPFLTDELERLAPAIQQNG